MEYQEQRNSGFEVITIYIGFVQLLGLRPMQQLDSLLQLASFGYLKTTSVVLSLTENGVLS